jgi:hypothetical protein
MYSGKPEDYEMGEPIGALRLLEMLALERALILYCQALELLQLYGLLRISH